MNNPTSIRYYIEPPVVPAGAAKFPNAGRYCGVFSAGVALGAVWCWVAILVLT